MIATLLAIAGFAASAALGLFAGRLVTAAYVPLADGPLPGHPRAPFVIATAALLGALAAGRGISPAPLAIFGIVCGILAAIWYTDVVRGVVPDAFTLLPLVAIAIAAGLSHRFDILLSAAIPAIPFAVLATLTRGRGLGWGDVKLAALGGALLGMQSAVLAFAFASAAAIVVARFRAERGRPIAFAPYLVLAIALPLAFGGG